MRRHDAVHVARRQFVEHRHRQRCALLRIGAGTQLVQQYQSSGVGLFEQSFQHFDMSGKRG